MSQYLGSLLGQMRNYWSAKKNQYLAPGGVKLIGHFEDYQEKDANGEIHQMYYQKICWRRWTMSHNLSANL